jgi:hypothetical protein
MAKESNNHDNHRGHPNSADAPLLPAMKIRKELCSVLYSDPFQLQMPAGLGLDSGTPDELYTFRLELSFGPGGVEGYMPLYTVDSSASKSGGPPWNWFSCLGLTQIPGLRPGKDLETSELRLYFVGGICFDVQHAEKGAIACWSESDPAYAALLHMAWPNLQNDEALKEAEIVFKRLLAEKFPLREVTDPAAQIPDYKPEHRDSLFGCAPHLSGPDL